GTFVDDILVYCRGIADYLLVVNAGNIEKDFGWIQSHPVAEANTRNVSADVAQLAIQGPVAVDILQVLVPDVKLADIGYYHFTTTSVAGIPSCIVSRTGYTGEDGFEV